MSTPQQRQKGRKVEPASPQPIQAFYWVIGIVALFGVAALVAYTTLGDPGSSTGAETSNAIPTPDAASAPPDETGGTEPKTADGFYYKGDADAPVTIVEYSDFQCPACAYHNDTTVVRLEEEYVNTGQVKLVFHDFPLSMHPNAPIASEAARCAGEQDAFWKMHDVLFDMQETWANNATTEQFVELATQAGVEDLAQFATCLESGKYTQFVSSAALESANAGIRATPTFVVDGKPVELGQLFAEVDAAVNAKSQE
jgi:protein-disulfide isomerase